MSEVGSDPGGDEPYKAGATITILWLDITPRMNVIALAYGVAKFACVRSG